MIEVTESTSSIDIVELTTTIDITTQNALFEVGGSGFVASAIEVVDELNPVDVDATTQVLELIDNPATTEISAVEPTTEIVEICLGPAGPKGADGTAAEQVNTAAVGTGQEAVIDSLAVSSYSAAKWVVTALDAGAGEYMSLEVIAVRTAVGIDYSIYGIVGDVIDVDIETGINAGFIELMARNNTPRDMDFSVMRIGTLVH